MIINNEVFSNNNYENLSRFDSQFMVNCCQLSHGLRTKKCSGHLHRVSRQPCMTANEKGDNEMIPGAVHRIPGIYLTDKESPGKLQLGDFLMKAV